MKKGFSLIELMASIIIISVISFIGVATYRNVSEKIKIQQYENKVSLIESKAALFASDTGYLYTNVQELVDEGYIEADNEKGEVISPKDKKNVLNKHVVTITQEGEDFYGHFSDKEEENINEVDRKNVNMEIKTIANGEEIEEGKWTNADSVLLKANITADYDQSKIKKITWYNGSVNLESKEISGDFESNNTYEVKVQQIANSSYRVEVELESGDRSIYYQATRVVKIDRQKPIAYKDEIKVENAEVWTKKNKATTIIGTDQNGSGIEGYHIGTSGICTDNKYYKACNANDKNCNPEKFNYDSQGNGTYYVCAKDNAGNIGNATPFIIEKIDDEVPTCEITVNGTPNANGWYNSDVKFDVNAVDQNNSDGTEGSGVISTNVDKVSDTSQDGIYVNAIVRDKAGNVGTCKTAEKIKIDTKAPECTKTGDSTTWATSRTITWGCSDTGSGCDPSNSGESKTYDNTNSNGTEIKTFEQGSYIIKDNAGNTTTCPAITRNVYVDLKAPTIPSVTLNKWADNDITPTATTGLSGSYISGSWSNRNIYTKASGSTDSGAGGVYYQYKTTGMTTNETATATSRNIKANGVSYISYRACDKLLNCSNFSVNQTIMIDKVKPNKPTINAYKWPTNDDSAKPTTSTNLSTLSSYTENAWSNKNIYTKATSSDPKASNGSSGSGISYYLYTVTGKSSNSTDTKAQTKNIKAEGTSYIKFKACDNAGNCSGYTDNFTIKIDKTAPTVSCKYYENGQENNICKNAGQGPLKYYYLCDYTDNLSGTASRNVTWGGKYEIEEKNALNNANGAAIDPDTLCMKTRESDGATVTYASGSLCDYAGNCR